MKRTQEEDRYQAVRNGIRAELAQCDCVLAGLGGEWEKGRGGEIRSAYQEKLKKKEIKKGKDGFFRNKQGFIVLSPR